MSTYSDLNGNFRPSNKNTSVLLYNMENIKDSLMRLFTTGKGECPFNREYGTTLKSLLFENSVDTSTAIMFLYMDITKWEPRVSIRPQDISIEKEDEHSYTINCTFTVPGLNNTEGSTETTITDL